MPRADISESDCLHQAAQAFMRHLKLPSEEVILDKLTIRDYKIGEHLTTQNDTEHVNHLYYIIYGEFTSRKAEIFDYASESSDLVVD